MCYSNEFYNVIQKRWPGAEIIGFDTDSFFLSIPTEDLYKDMLDIKDELDLSDYPSDKKHELSFLFSEDKQKVIGKFKDELMGEHMRAIAFN